jgi:hypothetical protein
MLVFKIYDCKLRKNRKKGAKQWRFNQNTTRVMWFNHYPYVPSYEQALHIIDNINEYFPTIKPQKNTRIEFYYK